MHVEVCCASAPASFSMAATCCHGLRESLLQMKIAPLLQPNLGVLTSGKGVAVHHTNTYEDVTQATPSCVIAISNVVASAQAYIVVSGLGL